MRDKLTKLMEKEGFILILFLSVCLIAGGTLFLSMRNINHAKRDIGDVDFVIIDGEEDQVERPDELELGDIDDIDIGFAESEDLLAEDEGDEEVLEVALEGNDELEIEELEFEDEDDEEESDWEAVESTNIQTFALPVDGEIITKYTSDGLVYSETLEAWVGHDGIDIRAKEGEVVKAAGSGVVKEVYRDELWGIVIVIDHGGGLLTKYSNLLTMDMVKEGLEVGQGDHISKVGSTAKIEMLMEPHLHFEVIKNGKIVDPRSIMD